MLAGARRSAKKKAYWRMKRVRRPLSEILANTGIDEAAYSKIWLAKIESPEYLPLDRVIPGAKQQLTKLKDLFQLVLVTLRHNREGLDEQLHELKLRPFFSHVLSRASLNVNGWEAKKDLISSSGLLSLPSWIVGDSEVDILAGKALGLTTVAVLSGIRDSKRLKEFEPDFIVDDIGDLRSSSFKK